MGRLQWSTPHPSRTSLFIHSYIHSCMHSFPSHIYPQFGLPPTQRLALPCRPPGGGRGVSLSPLPAGSCSCSGLRRPRRQRGAVPARLGRTRASGPSRSGGLGPVSQPRDLIQSLPGRTESSCSWGKEAGQMGGGVSGDVKNCGLCPLRSWSSGSGIIWGKTEPVDEAVSSCPCPGPRSHSLSSGGQPGTSGH